MILVAVVFVESVGQAEVRLQGPREELKERGGVGIVLPEFGGDG